VVVVVSGRVHTLATEAELASALLWSIPPGEEGGHAIADILTGAANPAGRLPVTLPLHVGQIPLHHDTRQRGDRSEFYGPYVDREVSPLFAFGHGLSYASFDYSELVVEPGSTTAPTSIVVEVTNTGERDGDEVVQLYVTDEVASIARPIRELVGFARVSIRAGVSRRLRFTVDPSRLAFHGTDMRLVTEPGLFTFRVGRSSDDPGMREAFASLAGDVAEYKRREIVATRVDVI
jgi:beta-glucosidase